jgi:plasmid stability protein
MRAAKGGVVMTLQTVTLRVPDVLYLRLKQRAAQTNRTVEAEVLDVLAGAIPVADELPPDLAAAVSPLAVLSDAALWQAAQSSLASEVATTLEELHLKRQRQALTEAEQQTLAVLLPQYERHLLVRAQAAALLKQRGHDVSHLVGLP